MEIQFNIPVAERKVMMKIIGDMVGFKVLYLGVPSYAYATGPFQLGLDGVLTIREGTDPDLVQRVLEELEAAGFVPEHEQQEEKGSISISLPVENLSAAALTNLDRILDSKGAIIKKAIGTNSLAYTVSGDAITFPWFNSADSDAVAAYTQFVAALVKMAATQHRVTAKSSKCDSERFAMRTFLIRLGFIGDEFKSARRILLNNLSGSSAYAKAPSVTVQ